MFQNAEEVVETWLEDSGKIDMDDFKPLISSEDLKTVKGNARERPRDWALQGAHTLASHAAS